MGAEAARRCLNDAGVDASAVDLIVVACATPDQSQPATACLIQEKLGIGGNWVPRVRRERGVQRLRLRAQRRAGDDADGAGAVPARAGDRRRRVLEDHELEGLPDLRLLRGRRRGRAADPDRRRRQADALPAGQRRARPAPHRGAGRRHAPARQRRGDGAPAEHLHDGRTEGVGLRRGHGPAHDPVRCSPSAASRPPTWTC